MIQHNLNHHVGNKKFAVLVFTLVLLSSLISGCGSTSINKKHILFEANEEAPAASVYFIRPFTYRERGMTDDPVVIELNRKEIISLGKGEYTHVRIKPVDATITTRNLSMFTNKRLPIEMTRSADMTFEAGQTYFIHIKQVNEEFRGVYYVPELVGLNVAKQMTADLKSPGVSSKADIENLIENNAPLIDDDTSLFENEVLPAIESNAPLVEDAAPVIENNVPPMPENDR